MATQEIDEEDLRRHYALRDTVNTLLSDPKAKLLVQQAVKLKYPNAVTPELDAAIAQVRNANATQTELDKLRQEIATDKADRENAERLRKLNTDFEAGFDRLRTQRGYTDAGIAEVRKLMEENGTLNHEMAANHFDRLHPPQEPMRAGSGAWGFMEPAADTGDDIKKLIETKGENPGLTDKMARDALSDVRGQPRR